MIMIIINKFAKFDYTFTKLAIIQNIITIFQIIILNNANQFFI